MLPVEYNLDPLGTGRLLGLVYLGEDQDDPVLRETVAYRVDRVEFELTPFESVEYKYGLAKDQALVFTWQATGEVVSDLHSEPAIAPPGYAESFDQYRGTSASGTYIAPFTGLPRLVLGKPRRSQRQGALGDCGLLRPCCGVSGRCAV